jgi:hypothetical protein
MWCNTCQQDTPGVAHATTGRIVCPRCQQSKRAKKPVIDARVSDDGIALDEQPMHAKAAAAPFRKDDWSARQRVRSLARELKRPGIVPRPSASMIESGRHRFEPPQDLFATLEVATATVATPAPLPAANATLPSRRAEGSQIIAWLIVTLGVLTLGAAVAQIAWSLSSKAIVNWNLALGLALGGQGLLIFGLILVVSRLWRHSRYAAGKLQDVHARLGQLQHTAEVLTTMRAGGGAPAFYAELARGANPHMLLTNLKGQLDQLATRLSGSG